VLTRAGHAHAADHNVRSNLAADTASLAAYRPRMADGEPHPDWGICRVCGQCVMLDDGVLPEHISDPDRASGQQNIPDRCRGEGHPPL
jgi:hypothetical protein